MRASETKTRLPSRVSILPCITQCTSCPLPPPQALRASPDVAAALAPVAEPAWKLVGEAAAKPATLRPDGIMGALVALRTATVAPAAGG